MLVGAYVRILRGLHTPVPLVVTYARESPFPRSPLPLVHGHARLSRVNSSSFSSTTSSIVRHVPVRLPLRLPARSLDAENPSRDTPYVLSHHLRVKTAPPLRDVPQHENLIANPRRKLPTSAQILPGVDVRENYAREDARKHSYSARTVIPVCATRAVTHARQF